MCTLLLNQIQKLLKKMFTNVIGWIELTKLEIDYEFVMVISKIELMIIFGLIAPILIPITIITLLWFTCFRLCVRGIITNSSLSY